MAENTTPLSSYQQMLAAKAEAAKNGMSPQAPSTPSTTPSSATTAKTPSSVSQKQAANAGNSGAEIPREDLIALTMKMSKRIKMVEAQNAKLKLAHLRSVAFEEAVTLWATTDLGAATTVDPVVVGDEANNAGKVTNGASLAADGAAGAVDLMAELSKWKRGVTEAEERKSQGEASRQQAHAETLAAKEAEVRKLEGELRGLRVDAARKREEGGGEVGGGQQKGGDGGNGSGNSSSGGGGGNGNGSLVEALQKELQTLEENVRVARDDASASRAATQTEAAKATSLEAQVRSVEGLLRAAEAGKKESAKQTQAALLKLRDVTAQGQASEESVVRLQMNAAAAGKEAEVAIEELKKNVAKAVEGRDRLKKALTDLRAKHKDALKQKEEHSEASGAASLMLMEKDVLLDSLGSELVALKARSKANAQALASSTTLKQRCEELELGAEQGSIALQELLRTKEELEGKAALVTRLRQESEAAEKLHATRTALVATREAELSSLKQEVEGLAGDKEGLERALEACEASARSVQAALTKTQAEHASAVAGLQGERGVLAKERSREVEGLKRLHEAELKAAQAEHGKKSSLARQLVKEKDDALKRVTAEVEELRDEVESGGHSEKKIMALAQSQALRETEMKSSVALREGELLKLHQALKRSEGSLQRSSGQVAELKVEVDKLRRTAGLHPLFLHEHTSSSQHPQHRGGGGGGHHASPSSSRKGLAGGGLGGGGDPSTGKSRSGSSSRSSSNGSGSSKSGLGLGLGESQQSSSSKEGATRVNLEYLKNVVLQYICLQDDGQRRTLARVLVTLLHFTSEEARRVEASHNDPWGLNDLWDSAWGGLSSSSSSSSAATPTKAGSTPFSNLVLSTPPAPRHHRSKRSSSGAGAAAAAPSSAPAKLNNPSLKKKASSSASASSSGPKSKQAVHQNSNASVAAAEAAAAAAATAAKDMKSAASASTAKQQQPPCPSQKL